MPCCAKEVLRHILHGFVDVWKATGVYMQLVLSVMPGIDLLGMAFKKEGFCVVQGGDPIFGGDVRFERYPSGKFSGLISGPACQSFSSLAHLVRANGHEPKFGNLIPEFERCVSEAEPGWFLMENVRGAPLPKVKGYATHSFLLDNSWIPGEDGMGQEQMRMRRFTFGVPGVIVPDLRRWIDTATFILPDPARGVTQNTSIGNSKEAKQRHPAITGGHDKPPSARTRQGKGRYRLADACRLQGLPEDFLKDAPFTADGKLKAVSNGVPIPMGRAIAKAIAEYHA
jgi:DNA (cytosine-5)-methyltransferase 1